MKTSAFAVVLVAGVWATGAFAQSGARTEDVIGTYYGAVQCVLNTDAPYEGPIPDTDHSHAHNFPELVLTGLLSFSMTANDVGYHQGSQGTLGYSGQTAGGIFFCEGLPYSVVGDFLVVPFSSPKDDNGGKNNKDIDYQLLLTWNQTINGIGHAVQVGEASPIQISGKLKKARDEDKANYNSAALPAGSTARKPWTLDSYLERRRGNRKVRYEDTDRDKILGDTVVWVTWADAPSYRYDEAGAPHEAEADFPIDDVNDGVIEQYWFEVARISKTPGQQAFGDKLKIRR